MTQETKLTREQFYENLKPGDVFLLPLEVTEIGYTKTQSVPLKPTSVWLVGIPEWLESALKESYHGAVKIWVDDLHSLLLARQLEIKKDKPKTERPKIVCLCASTRFYEKFQEANYWETMNGNIVLSVGFYKDKGNIPPVTEEEKKALDKLHLKKIDLADEILVLNVGGYIGESTTNEIKYAMLSGKKIRFLEEPENNVIGYMQPEGEE